MASSDIVAEDEQDCVELKSLEIAHRASIIALQEAEQNLEAEGQDGDQFGLGLDPNEAPNARDDELDSLRSEINSLRSSIVITEDDNTPMYRRASIHNNRLSQLLINDQRRLLSRWSLTLSPIAVAEYIEVARASNLLPAVDEDERRLTPPNLLQDLKPPELLDSTHPKLESLGQNQESQRNRTPTRTEQDDNFENKLEGFSEWYHQLNPAAQNVVLQRLGSHSTIQSEADVVPSQADQTKMPWQQFWKQNRPLPQAPNPAPARVKRDPKVSYFTPSADFAHRRSRSEGNSLTLTNAPKEIESRNGPNKDWAKPKNLGIPPDMYVRALYDYDSDDRTNLSFRTDDVIRVISTLESGWWDGVINGVRGWFPSNYCDVITPNDSDIGSGESDVDSTAEIDDSTISELTEEFGLDIGDKPSAAAFWIPQATSDGRLFYYNTLTGVSTARLPLDDKVVSDDAHEQPVAAS